MQEAWFSFLWFLFLQELASSSLSLQLSETTIALSHHFSSVLLPHDLNWKMCQGNKAVANMIRSTCAPTVCNRGPSNSGCLICSLILTNHCVMVLCPAFIIIHNYSILNYSVKWKCLFSLKVVVQNFCILFREKIELFLYKTWS